MIVNYSKYKDIGIRHAKVVGLTPISGTNKKAGLGNACPFFYFMGTGGAVSGNNAVLVNLKFLNREINQNEYNRKIIG